MAAYIRFLLRHRALVLIVCGAVTVAAAAIILVRANLGTSLGKLFLGETPAYYEYLERIREFASDEVVILAGLTAGERVALDPIKAVVRYKDQQAGAN